MSRVVASALSSGARDTYERWLFLRYALLPDIMHNVRLVNTSYESLLEQLTLLDSIKAQDLVKQGTPFFWLSVHLCSLVDVKHQNNIDTIVNNLLITAFDSYYDYLPDGGAFRLGHMNEDSVLTLPRLGIQIPISGNTTLRRISLTKLEVKISENYKYFDLGNIDSKFRLPAISIPGYEYIKLLMVSDRTLFDSYSKSIMSTIHDANNFANTLSESLNLIKIVDPVIHMRLTSLIKWLVPITAPNQESHNSSTSDKLVGVLFLSEAEKIRIAEAMVHEFHHSELHMIMYHQLLRSTDNGKYYSPWREDPRPLYGLLHGIHAFAGIADFFAKAESIANLNEHVRYFRHRIIQIYYQLQLALAQVPTNKLGPLGYQMIESIEKDVERYREHLDMNGDLLPQYLEAHLRDWCGRNPELAANVKRFK